MKQNSEYPTITVAVVVVIVAYLGFDLLKPCLYLCESIFQQTTTQIGGNMVTIQAKGDLFIGAILFMCAFQRMAPILFLHPTTV